MLSPKKFERQYVKAKRQLKQGKLSQEAYFRQVSSWQDYDWDGRFYQLGRDGQWLVYDPAYARWFLTGKRVRSPAHRHAKLISLLSLILVVAILLALPATRTWILMRLPAGLVSDYAYYRAPKAPTTEETPARDQVLTPVITLHAPAGVLSGDDSLSASEVPWDQASNQMNQAGLPYPVLYAFDFEAGLDEEESFSKAVALEIDLDQADIPVDAVQDLVVYRLGDDGPEKLRFTVEGRSLTVYTKKNSLIGICLCALALIGNIGLFYAFVRTENKMKYGDSQYLAYTIPGEKYSSYTLYWPVNHPYSQPRDSSRQAEIRREIEEVTRRGGLSWDQENQRFDIRSREAVFELMHSDTYRQLSKKLGDLAFLLKYIYPEKLALVVESVIACHDYLFEVRHFTPVSYGVDIVLRDPWVGKATLTGAMSDLFAKYPFIKINLPIVLVSAQRPDAQAVRTSQDELLVTVTHEMFHIVQEEYKNLTLDKNLHFCEATAMLLESESVDYYRKRRLLHDPNYTYRAADLYEYFEAAWGTDSDKSGPTGHTIASEHGYTFYHVLKHNRDTNPRWSAAPDKFLPALMDYYTKHENALSLHYASFPGLMQNYALAQGDILTTRLDQIKFRRGANVRTLSSINHTLELADLTWKPYSAIVYKLDIVPGARPAALLLKPNGKALDGIDWLGLSVSQDPVGAGMKFQAIPDAGNRFVSMLDKRIYVMPANDSYLMITQGMTESNSENKIGYAVNAWLAVQPIMPTVTFDKNSCAFIFKLPDSSYEDHIDFRGRLIEIEASNPSIKPYRTIVAPGSNEIRIPIEAIIYGSEDKASLVEQLLANGLVISLQSMIQLMTSLPLPYEGLSITEKNGVFTFTADTSKIEDYKEHELFRNSISMAMKAVNGTVSIEFRTDKGYQAATAFNMGELLDYLRYARKLYATANTPYTREVEKYESTFTARISDVFGSDTVIDPYQVKDYSQVMNKSVSSVSGPASESTPPFKGEGLETMEAILPGTYTGEMFISFTTNMVPSEYLKQFSMVTVVIDSNQTVKIIIANETLYGKLGKTEIPGRFQYFERIGEGDNATYRPLEGAFGSYSEDGTLVFTFIPARLKRR